MAAPAAARARARRRLALAALAGRVVGVDGHNLLITLETALRGERLLLADDGWVRDTARLGRHHAPGPVTWRAAALLVSSLAGAGAAGALILLDAPLPRSGELAAGLRDLLARAGLPGEARAVAVPERELVVHPGPVASGDSALIDRVALPVDLAGKSWAAGPAARRGEAQVNQDSASPSRPPRALGLLSGGLDSILACLVLRRAGVEVAAVSFATPFFGAEKARAAAAAHAIPLTVLEVGPEHLATVVKHPRYGYGSQMNPCIDCHAYMFRKAGALLDAMEGDFLFSGEVLGQRPMSQNRQSLGLVAKLSGQGARILRPLSARLLPPTSWEEAGR